MPSITPVTVIDRAATPKSHVYAPEGVKDGVGSFAERLMDGSFVGEPKLSVSNRFTPARRTKASMRLSIPKVITEVVNSVSIPKVVGTSHFRFEADWDPQHTDLEREAILGQIEKLFGTAVQQPFVNPVLKGKETVFSG